MPSFGFIGPSYQTRALVGESERWINMYIERIESGHGASPGVRYQAYPTPGKALMVALDDTPVAALAAAAAAAPVPTATPWKYFAVSGETLYWIEADYVADVYTGTAHSIGTVAKQVLPGTGGQLAPAQIVVLGQNLIFVVAAGDAWLAGYGSAISATALNQGGSGYAVNDTGTIQGGLIPATYTVTSVDGSGAVLTYSVTANGTGYAAGTNILTSTGGLQPGSGSGFTIDISSVGAAAWSLVNKDDFMADVAPVGSFIRSATFLDGYLIISFAPNSNDPERRQFFISGLNDYSTWNALDFGTKEGAPDSMLAVFAAYEYLLLFGLQTTEIWQNSGNALFAFQRVSGGGVIETGLTSYAAVSKMDNTVVWLGQDQRGGPVAWQLQGQTPVRISNHAVEDVWNKIDIGTAISYCYSENGHWFWCLSFPAADRTFVYDSTIGPAEGWHERAFWDGSAFHADIARYHCKWADGPHIVGDYSNGNLYVQSVNILTDNCSAIRRIRITPHIVNERKWNFYQRFRLHCLTGVVPATGAGSNPVMSLRISNDGGRTYGPYIDRNCGTLGEYSKVVEWYHLGRSRDRVFEWSCSEPIDICLVDGYVEYTEGMG